MAMIDQRSFKQRHSYEERFAEANRILTKFPGRIPVIVARAANAKTNIPALDKEKYLVPGDLSVSQFIYVIRRRMTLTSEQALFLFIGGSLPTTSMLMRELYAMHKDADNFLYAEYCSENTFGEPHKI